MQQKSLRPDKQVPYLPSGSFDSLGGPNLGGCDVADGRIFFFGRLGR